MVSSPTTFAARWFRLAGVDDRANGLAIVQEGVTRVEADVAVPVLLIQ
jgi:hypothetical protein